VAKHPTLSLAFASFLAFAVGATSAAPAGYTVDLSARVAPTATTVGDPVRYEITVTLPPDAPENTRVELPGVRGNTGALEVLDHTVRTDRTQNAKRTIVHTLTLAAYEVGADTLPPQRVEVRVPPDTAALVVYTEPVILTVKSVANAGDSLGLADIHDEERMPRPFPWALPVALALLAALVWAFRTWRKHVAALRARPVPPPPAPVVTAAEAALARLETLRLKRTERREAGANLDSRTFAFTLSEILREYMAARFGIDALEATSSELLMRAATLTSHTLKPEQHNWLRVFCDETDTVKFADAALSAADEARLLEDVRTFVRSTADKPALSTALTTDSAPSGSSGGVTP
jgi:hypothetical protein